MPAIELASHVDEIVREHRIYVRTHSRGGRAWRRSRIIAIRPVRSPITYAVALHEIGHIIGPDQSGWRLVKEAGAWRWAIDNAREWTPSMDRKMRKCLQSYVAWAHRRKARGSRKPPVIPNRNHYFWDLIERGAS